jgi:L-seryl-tRNA(Ser) seleniumtransferase
MVRRGEALLDAAEVATEEAQALASYSLRPVLNLSGVVLHTGLGRARLAPSVAEHVAQVARDHSAVEFDLEGGQRGDRQSHVRDLLCNLTGAEDALVVNNAAAAVVLTLASLCAGRGVALSRGQMVEIGGSFRMPEIVAQSGCRLIEVGCTNKTRLSDFAAAIEGGAAALLRCHPSNYRIVGFTQEPSLAELSALAGEKAVLLIDDQGSGCLVDTTTFGLPRQPRVQDSVAAGSDVVMASGDKLLGGPQAGIIVGRGEHLRQIRRHPLARAFRIDKLSLAALEATLRLYTSGQELEIPTLRYLNRKPEEVKALAEAVAEGMDRAEVLASSSEVGAGSAPGTGLATWAVSLDVGDPDGLAQALRRARPSIVGRVQNGRVWLDPRTLEEDEVPVVREVLAEALTRQSNPR